MAGQFDSVIGINDLDELANAVRRVLDSRRRAGAADTPIAVLIQPLIEPAFGGVLFGADPVSGRSDHRVVSAVAGGPDALVSGVAAGSRFVLDERGRVVERDTKAGPKLARRDLRRLAALSGSVARVFERPQDVEWAIGADGKLWLLQSRPVTTEILGAPTGPVYGPGPVAETFPAALSQLEADLWVPPLREAVAEAVVLAGIARRRDVEASGVVVVVEGQVAIDLRLAGELRPPTHVWSRLNPLPGARALRNAWRVGRLKAALPALVDRALDQADADLAAVPPLDSLANRQIVTLLHRTRDALRALHADEILIGSLLDRGGDRLTGAAVALGALDEARRDGLSDDAIIERNPVVLALSPPRVAPGAELPREAVAVPTRIDDDVDDNAVRREALRLRVRWMQELSGRAAWTLGARLAAAGVIERADCVRNLSLAQLEAVATGAVAAVECPPDHVETTEAASPAPLPARFRLSDAGRPIRERVGSAAVNGTGAGGGRGTGPVTHDATNPPVGAVLVTRTLTPGLGPLLPRLRGIVAETGSVLSHLAILAREAGVPTVVGYAEALDVLAEGVVVEVDGDTGRVTERGAEGVA
jgi:pyruvate,water dikinase